VAVKPLSGKINNTSFPFATLREIKFLAKAQRKLKAVMEKHYNDQSGL
jgi:hypothetical protein